MKSFKIEQKIKNSDGYKFMQRIREFSVSTSIFGKNFLELSNHIKAELEPEYYIKLQHKEFSYQREQGQLETVRLMHNFLASASSLVDHTRNYYRKYYAETGKFPDYQTEIDNNFTNNKLANFIKCFRQYMQHFQPSFIIYQSSLSDDPTKLNAKIILTKSDLLLFSNWNSKAKQYIQDLEGDLEILPVFSDYHLLIEKFYNWFVTSQGKIHQSEVSELLALERAHSEEQLKELIIEFCTSGRTSCENFTTAVMNMYAREDRSKIESMPLQKQISEMVYTLKKKHFIDSAHEAIIRARFSY
jgi:hypothetical protein